MVPPMWSVRSVFTTIADPRDGNRGKLRKNVKIFEAETRKDIAWKTGMMEIVVWLVLA